MRKRDFLVIAALLFLSAASFLCRGFFQKATGDTVRIEVDGRLYQRAALFKDQEIPVKNSAGEVTNLVQIENGEVYMKEADCPDHLCIRQGHIRSQNASIVCLPNRVVVSVEKAASGEMSKENEQQQVPEAYDTIAQ